MWVYLLASFLLGWATASVSLALMMGRAIQAGAESAMRRILKDKREA